VPASDIAIYGGFNASQRRPLVQQRGLVRPNGMAAINALVTCCGTCGLPLSGENLITEPGRRPGAVRRRCRACTRRRKTEDMRRYRAAARGDGAAS
jgi:hypothetical protein